MALLIAQSTGAAMPAATVSLSAVTITDNRAMDTSGGGVCILTPVDLQSPTVVCATPAKYWPWQYSTNITVANSSILRNGAVCSVCSGGGLWLSAGGQLVLVNSTVLDNAAGQFGGGLALGVGGAPLPTCSLVVEGGSVGANSASHGGAQLYIACGGDILLNAPLQLSLNASQVRRLTVCVSKLQGSFHTAVAST
jgi:hypothetical protein